MCWRCDELDKVITHYRELGYQVTDPQTRAGLATLIEKLEAEKKSYHPEQAGPSRRSIEQPDFNATSGASDSPPRNALPF
jgi:hypothetical protein